MLRLPLVPVASLVAGAFVLAGCGEGTGPNASRQVGVGFRLATTSTATGGSATGQTGTSSSAAATSSGFSIKSGTDEILITKAQVVVKNVKLKATSAVCADDDDDDMDGDDEDDCPVVTVGPYLVDVPVSGGDGGRVAVKVPEGRYSAIRLTIHKVSSSDSADRAFRRDHPDFRDISIRLAGTFNTRPFVFTHDINARLDVPLSAPITISEGGDDVTVAIDMTDWFLKPGGGLYSPAEGNVPGLVRAKIQNNIRNAFRAFRDRDRDGKDDDR